MPPIFHADSDLGTLIYIIAVFIWVVANVFSKSRKKKNRRAPIPHAGESSAEAELREWLENMARGKEEEPEPAPAPVVPARVQRVRQRAKTAPPNLVPPATMRRYEPKPEPAPIDLEEVYKKLRDGAPSMAGSFSTTLSSRGSLFKMAGAALPNFRYALSSTRPRPAVPIITRETLTSRDQIRRMMAGKIILGAPRALDPYTGDTDAMVMK